MADFLMPILGADMKAGTLVVWRKQPGDAVRRGDIVAEVETDKTTVEMEAMASGTPVVATPVAADALEAGALQAFGPTRQRATQAASAGMDLILCSSQDLNQGEQARIALQQDLTSGTLNHAAFMAAVERIVSLRSSLRR